MAYKRLVSGAWRYVVKHRLLPKPYQFSYKDEAEGDAYAAAVELDLARGIVPLSIAQRTQLTGQGTIGEVAVLYAKEHAMSPSDTGLLETLVREIGAVEMPLTYGWTTAWVKTLKGEAGGKKALAPGTIRKKVECLARMIDWHLGEKKGTVSNPLRQLPKGYSGYPKRERRDIQRDRRISPEEEVRIRAVLSGGKPEGRERALKPDPLMLLILEIALESAMRLREIYSLTPDQVSVAERTMFLTYTKNGSQRQVPISSALLPKLQGFAGFPYLDWSKWKGDPKARAWQAELRRCTSLLSRRWSTVFDMAGCVGLNFHDTRHEAICRLFLKKPRMDLAEISRITGHEDLNMLRRYLSLRGSELADKIG